MNFSLAQVILIVLMVGVIAYVFTVRSVSRDRAVMLVLAAAGCLLVLWPGLSTDVAHGVGIGRGTDLIFDPFRPSSACSGSCQRPPRCAGSMRSSRKL